jgi:hypothetical protein
MSQTSHEPQHRATSTDESVARLQAPLPVPEHRPSKTWQGWAYFAGAIMAILGLFWAALGLIALFDQEFLTVRENRLLALESYASWGWVHLVGGLIALAAGAGILWGGHRWARNLGVVVAALSAVVNLGFLAAAPVWSTLVIALDIIAIYALTVHGWAIDESR